MLHFIVNHRSTRAATALLTFLLLCSVVISAVGQTRPASSGTDFILSLPHLYLDLDADLLITVTAGSASRVSIVEKDRGDSTSRFLAADSAWHFRIPRSAVGFPLQQQGRSNRSVRIRSTGPVTVQAAYDGDYVTDSWLVPPIRDLGTEHTVLSIWSPSVSGGVFTVTATEPGTTVRITPSVATSLGPAGFSYSITLDEGEVWQVVPTIPEFTDLSGSRVVSDKPVYVLGGHAGARLFGRGANNPMIEWMPPLTHRGSIYIAEPYPRRPEGLYKILADFDGTELFVNNVAVDTLDAGESRWWIDPFPVIFSSSKPMLVAQFVDHRDTSIATQDGDPSMTILQPVRAWSRSYVWQTLDLPSRFVQAPGSDAKLRFDSYLVVAADFSDGTHPVMLDGRDISDFLGRRIGGTGYAIGWIPMTGETHHLESPEPVSAQAMGFNVFDAYAHPVGYPVPPLVDVPDIRDTLCEDRYSGTLRIRNRTDELVRIDSVTTRQGALQIGLAAGRTLRPSESIETPVILDAPTIGPAADNVVIHVSGTRTGRTSIVSATVEILRLPLFLSTSAGEIDFSTATPAEPELERDVTLRNDGALPLRLIEISVPPPFFLVSPDLPISLDPGDSALLRIAYRPENFPATDRATLSVFTEPCPVDLSVELTGLSDVERVPTISADTVRSFCPGDSVVQIIRFANGTAFEVTLDSVEVDRDLRILADPSPRTVGSGDDIEIRVGWEQSGIGINRAVVRIFANGRRDPVLLELIHIQGLPGLAVTPRRVDVGRVLFCAEGSTTGFSFEVRNTGNVPLPGVSLRSTSGSVFFSADTLSIPEDRSVRVEAMLGGVPGVIYDTVLIGSPYCDETDTLVVAATLVAPELVLSLSDSTIAGPLGCDFPQSIDLRVTNRSSEQDSITRIASILGVLSTSAAMPIVVPAGASVTLPVTIEPTSPFTGIDSLQVYSRLCRKVTPVPVTVDARSTSWRVSPDTLRVRGVLPQEERSDTLRVWNDGQLPLELTSAALSTVVDGLSIEPDRVGEVVDPGQFVELIVTYETERPLASSSTILIGSSSCVDALEVVVETEPGIIPLSLDIEGGSDDIDGVLSLPLVLRSSAPSAEPATFDVQLSWPQRGLWLEEIRSESTTIVAREVEGLNRVVTLRHSATPAPSDTIAWLDFRLLLSDSEAWQIVMSGDRITGDPERVRYSMEYRGDSISISEICRVDGTRLLALIPTIYTLSVVPHPVSGSATVTVHSALAEEVEADISLVDILGTTLDQFRQILRPGDNDIVVDLSAYPQGTYRLVIESGSINISRELVRQ